MSDDGNDPPAQAKQDWESSADGTHAHRSLRKTGSGRQNGTTAGNEGGLLAKRRRLTEKLPALPIHEIPPGGTRQHASSSWSGGALPKSAVPKPEGIRSASMSRERTTADSAQLRPSTSDIDDNESEEPEKQTDAGRHDPTRGPPGWRRVAQRTLEHRYMALALVVMTVYVVIGEDLRLACLPPRFDLPMEAVTAAFVGLFSLEIVASSLVREGFFMSFYFWLDVIATTSLLFQLNNMQTKVLGWTEEQNFTQYGVWNSATGQGFVAAQAGRVARVFRLMRMLQLLRTYREFEARMRLRRELAALVAATRAAGEEVSQATLQAQAALNEQLLLQEYSESRLGQHLSERTIRRVIVMVILLLICSPLFEVDLGTFGRYTSAGQGGLKMLHDLAILEGPAPGGSSLQFNTSYKAFIETVVFELGIDRYSSYPYILTIKNATYVDLRTTVDRRSIELIRASYSTAACQLPSGHGDCWESVGVYDIRWYSQTKAILGLLRTTFVILLLSAGAYFFSYDTRKLVLEPVERMVRRVKELADNPLAQAALIGVKGQKQPPTAKGSLDVKSDVDSKGEGSFADRKPRDSLDLICTVHHAADSSSPGGAKGKPPQEQVMRQLLRRAKQVWLGVSSWMARRCRYCWAKIRRELGFKVADADAGGQADGEAEGTYETRVLEMSIAKICMLLAVGFGDAGAAVIAENIKSEGDINPMVPGKRVLAIFGFCDIRQFTDTTEVLQEEVMEFVNSIARIVHSSVASRGGFANKNIGDAFLLVWKLPRGIRMRDVRSISTMTAMLQQHSSWQSESMQASGRMLGMRLPSRHPSAAWPGLATNEAQDLNTPARFSTAESGPDEAGTRSPQQDPGSEGDVSGWRGFRRATVRMLTRSSRVASRNASQATSKAASQAGSRVASQSNSGAASQAPSRSSSQNSLPNVSPRQGTLVRSTSSSNVRAPSRTPSWLAGPSAKPGPHDDGVPSRIPSWLAGPSAKPGSHEDGAASTASRTPSWLQGHFGKPGVHEDGAASKPPTWLQGVHEDAAMASYRPRQGSRTILKQPDALDDPTRASQKNKPLSGTSFRWADMQGLEQEVADEPLQELPGTATRGAEEEPQDGTRRREGSTSSDGSLVQQIQHILSKKVPSRHLSVGDVPAEVRFGQEVDGIAIIHPRPPIAPAAPGEHIPPRRQRSFSVLALRNSISAMLGSNAVVPDKSGGNLAANDRPGAGALHLLPAASRRHSAVYPATVEQLAASLKMEGDEQQRNASNILRPVPNPVAQRIAAASRSNTQNLDHPAPSRPRTSAGLPFGSEGAAEAVRKLHNWSTLTTSNASTKTLSAGSVNPLLRNPSLAASSARMSGQIPWADKARILTSIADNALASFVMIQVALKRSRRLHQYSLREDLRSRIPGFRVQMGFGLHVGWAIEGAIGSEYKIDASYLSPNVNMASRLEAATKQFNVPLLMSEDFFRCLSPQLRTRVRQIDCVTVKGSAQPVGLFTYDISLDAIAQPTGHSSKEDDPEPDPGMYGDEWEENEELKGSWALNDAYMEVFEAGFRHYQEGRWMEAREALEWTRTARSSAVDGGGFIVDGPSDVLLKYMGGLGFRAPVDWRGYRELTEK